MKGKKNSLLRDVMCSLGCVIFAIGLFDILLDVLAGRIAVFGYLISWGFVFIYIRYVDDCVFRNKNY